MGVRPKHATDKQRKVAMSHCRQFLTTALRRRERLLATLPKPRKARSQVVDRCPWGEEEDQVDAAAVVENAADLDIDIADQRTIEVHEGIVVNTDKDADVDSHCEPRIDGDGDGEDIVVRNVHVVY